MYKTRVLSSSQYRTSTSSNDRGQGGRAGEEPASPDRRRDTASRLQRRGRANPRMDVQKANGCRRRFQGCESNSKGASVLLYYSFSPQRYTRHLVEGISSCKTHFSLHSLRGFVMSVANQSMHLLATSPTRICPQLKCPNGNLEQLKKSRIRRVSGWVEVARTAQETPLSSVTPDDILHFSNSGHIIFRA